MADLNEGNDTSWSNRPSPRDWSDSHISRMVRSTHPEWEHKYPKEWAKAEHPSREFTVAKLNAEKAKEKGS